MSASIEDPAPRPDTTKCSFGFMLASLVLQLEPQREAALPKTNGHLVHGAFLEAAGRIDPGLAERLHADEPAKPFTVSALRGGRRQGQEKIVAPGRPCYIRLTSLAAGLSEALLDRREPEHPLRLGETWRIGKASFTIAALHSSPGDHAWAGRDSYEALARRFERESAASGRPLKLAFESPTTFRRGKRNIPLPLPSLVFKGLVEKWEHHAPLSMCDVFEEWPSSGGAASVLLKRHKELGTHMLKFGSKGKQVGFTGEATFQLPKRADTRLGTLLHLLGTFAFYAGIGYRTPWGMGQVRIT